MTFKKLRNLMLRRYENKHATEEEKKRLDSWATAMCEIITEGKLVCKQAAVNIGDDALELQIKKKFNLPERFDVNICELHLLKLRELLNSTESSNQQ